jgi:predicted nuclease of predicted toxin-antitoxin system
MSGTEGKATGPLHFVADESVAGQLVKALRATGRKILSIAEERRGIRDEQVLGIAHDRNTILLTEDKDFGELVHANGAQHSGIVLIRLDGLRAHEKTARVVMAINAHEAELPGAFTVIDRHKIRIRLQP